MLYFSFEVKMAPKRKVGAQKNFFGALHQNLPPHFQFASYALDISIKIIIFAAKIITVICTYYMMLAISTS